MRRALESLQECTSNFGNCLCQARESITHVAARRPPRVPPNALALSNTCNQFTGIGQIGSVDAITIHAPSNL